MERVCRRNCNHDGYISNGGASRVKNKQQALEDLNKKYNKTLNLLEDDKKTKLEKQKGAWEDWVDPIIMSSIAIFFIFMLALLLGEIIL